MHLQRRNDRDSVFVGHLQKSRKKKTAHHSYTEIQLMQSADSFIRFILPSLLELKHSKNCNKNIEKIIQNNRQDD